MPDQFERNESQNPQHEMSKHKTRGPRSPLPVVAGSIYDYPRYYDLAYGSDWRAEFDFLLGCFRQHAGRTVERVFEPACGTGRLLYRLARAGFDVAGIDLNAASVEFCNDRLARLGSNHAARTGDMTSFRLPRKADAAFNMLSTFRHLSSDAQARSHLECMAESLRRGGIYVLGVHLAPTSRTTTDYESWSARRGHLAINVQMRVKKHDRRRRQERIDITFDVYTPSRAFRIADELVFRTYTARQFKRLIGQVAAFEVVETFDFAYDIRRPVVVSECTEDVIYVLRKR